MKPESKSDYWLDQPANVRKIVYALYTVCAILSVAFVLKMVHETRGIELEDMQG